MILRLIDDVTRNVADDWSIACAEAIFEHRRFEFLWRWPGR